MKNHLTGEKSEDLQELRRLKILLIITAVKIFPLFISTATKMDYLTISSNISFQPVKNSIEYGFTI